jgi:hypothetical protein
VAAFPRLPDPWPFLLFLTGGLGPLVGAAWVVRHGDRAYRGAFLRRLWDPRRIPVRWWFALVAVAAGPAVFGAVVAEVAGTAVTVPDLGVGHVGGVLLLQLAVLYTWLANGAGGSILLAILAHAGTNAVGELVPRSTLGDVLAFVVVAAATAAVVATTRGRLRLEVAAPAISDTMVYPDTGRSTRTV